MAAKSKTVATWLALALGSLGAHRFYLHGWRDKLGWAHPLPTLLGAVGAIRLQNLGQDDHAAWLLIPLLGLMLAASMLTAIVFGLTPDETWAARYRQAVQPTGWGPVIGVVVALLVGGTVLMGAIAFGGEKFFEYRALGAH
jgi:hypothetical protein